MTEQMTVNIPLLRKAVEWAEAESASEMGQWYQGNWVYQHPVCGTSYCIAGWVMREQGWTDEKIKSPATATAAAELLGIEGYWDSTDEHLFAPENTVEDVRRIAEGIAGERL